MVGVGPDLIICEMGEGGVEEEGEDTGEGRGVDQVGCFVQ